MTTPGLGEVRERLGEHLYLSFWGRNGWVDLTSFAEQAEPIRQMWFGIADDAITHQAAELARLEEEVKRWKWLADNALAEWVAWKDRCEHQAAP